jgi:protein-disulfide isomerase
MGYFSKGDKVYLWINAILIILIIAFIVKIDSFFQPPNIDNNFISKYQNISMYNKEGSNPNAKVTIVEYADYLCPYCKISWPNVIKLINTYGNKVNFVFKHYPIHDGSLKLAIAAECAKDQDKFLDYSTLLFNSVDTSYNSLINYANSLKMNLTIFGDCLKNGNKSSIVEKDISDAINSGVSGTPTYIINKQVIEGELPMDRVIAMIEGYLND